MDALRQEPDGLSRNELYKRVECNPGTFRRQLGILVSSGEVTVSMESRRYGPTAVHRLSVRTSDAV